MFTLGDWIPPQDKLLGWLALAGALFFGGVYAGYHFTAMSYKADALVAAQKAAAQQTALITDYEKKLAAENAVAVRNELERQMLQQHIHKSELKYASLPPSLVGPNCKLSDGRLRELRAAVAAANGTATGKPKPKVPAAARTNRR